MKKKSKKKSSKIVNIFIALVFLVGAGIFTYPTISDLWNQYRNAQLISTYDQAVTDLSDDNYEKLWKEAEEYNPIQKHHHSTVKFVAELCKELNVKNVIMSHTVDTDLENRKILFTEDAHKYYNGNVFVPNDLEVIEIKTSILG